MKDQKEYMKEYWKRNPEKYLENQKKQRRICREHRFEVLRHYGGKPPQCACCGENERLFLELDHVFGGGNKERKQNKNRSASSFYLFLIKIGFPKGYQILCSNCNRAKDVSNRGRKKSRKFCPIHHPELYDRHKVFIEHDTK